MHDNDSKLSQTVVLAFISMVGDYLMKVEELSGKAFSDGYQRGWWLIGWDESETGDGCWDRGMTFVTVNYHPLQCGFQHWKVLTEEYVSAWTVERPN